MATWMTEITTEMEFTTAVWFGSRTDEYTQMGNVCWNPIVKKLISKLLNDHVKAKIADAASAEAMCGRMMCRSTSKREHPRSIAASSCTFSNRKSWAATIAVTSGNVQIVCVAITVRRLRAMWARPYAI